MTTEYKPQSDALPRPAERVDEFLSDALEHYPSHVQSLKVDSKRPIEDETVELQVELKQDVRSATVKEVFDELYNDAAREKLEQNTARAFYNELGFDEGREGVVACYVTEEDVESFLESDGDFVETEDRFIFPLIFENKAKIVSYSGTSEDVKYEERVVNGEKALVNVGGENRIQRSHTQEMQWDGADFLIGQQKQFKWAGDSKARTKFLAVYLDKLREQFENH